MITLNPEDNNRIAFYRWANALALITIFYNLIEGIISVYFGFEDGTITLFGFGIDSFVEVISGVGIWHMVRKMKVSGNEDPDRFERTALRVTGSAFFILAAGLIVTASINLYQDNKPQTTLWGVIIGAISIGLMWSLIHFKEKTGRRFNSAALLADAACTKTCLYLSIVLLVASIGYEATGIGALDSLGAIGIAVFSYREGREAFEIVRGQAECGCRKCN